MFDKIRVQFSNYYDRVTKTELQGKDLDKVLDEFQLSLVENDVAVSVADYVATELKEKLKDVQIARFSDPRGRVKAILSEVLLSVLDRAGRLDIFELVEAKKKAGEPAIIEFVGGDEKDRPSYETRFDNSSRRRTHRKRCRRAGQGLLTSSQDRWDNSGETRRRCQRR